MQQGSVYYETGTIDGSFLKRLSTIYIYIKHKTVLFQGACTVTITFTSHQHT